jgi:hypothetical protein
MKKIFYILFFVSTTILAQVKSPAEFLGYELGTAFTRHYEVVNYVEYIAENSPLVEFIEYGKTYENRSLNLAFISSAENIENLEEIRKDNLKRAGVLQGQALTKIPIVWLSYNVHGNEASATEAALRTIFELITTKQEWLKNVVVIIDPSVNPDGRDRYVNWYHQTKNTPYNTNPNVIEHQEPWPGGRPNHYLFDLNRDWAWATQIETQQRLKVYNEWLPQVHADFHEQFINSPYYFPPAAEPMHEIITDWQREFQVKVGKNHAKHFDANGWRYFTKQHFDLLYPGYGDTYPTFMGAIGMTYEQAGHGRAGLGIITENGSELTLIDRIKHHTTTGISTVEVAVNNSSKLLTQFEKFYDNSSATKNYIVRGEMNKINSLISLLKKHNIESYPADSKTVKAIEHASGKTKTLKTQVNDWVIPTNQPKGKMVEVLFEPNTKVVDSVTYDITAWSLPFAYGLACFETNSALGMNTSAKLIKKKNYITGPNNPYAYVSKWNHIENAQFLVALLNEGINVRFAEKSFEVEGNKFQKGSLVILKGENSEILEFDEIIREIAQRTKNNLIGVSTGFVENGSDFGSSDYNLIAKKKVAVLSGKGTYYSSFGEVWHFFETQLHYPINVLNTDFFNRVNLNNYDVLILPQGFRANKSQFDKITAFTANGGTLICIGSAVNNFANKEGYALKYKSSEIEQDNLKAYNSQTRSRIENSINGTIFNATVDITHPLAFGYENEYFSLKQSGTSYELLSRGTNVAYFNKDAINISGFAGYKALKNVPNSLLFGIERKGRGKIVYMVDNPLFRSFWENGKLFIANAIFFN